MSPNRHTLLFRPSPTPSHPIDLPPYISRHYIPTPLGTLELLSAQPSPSTSPTPTPRKKAILFQHGGFGHATVWLPFLTFFSQRGYPCYALSLRGHGASWKPSFFSLVWRCGLSSMAQDLKAGLKFMKKLEAEKRGGETSEENLVLVGHSAGGGLVQWFLSEGMGRVGALVILAGFPNFGGLRVYWNWFKLDPWFSPRFFFRDLWHPRSPLSSTKLVHRAFFSPEYPDGAVKKFENLMPEYESLVWPLGMIFTFVNVKNVLQNIVGWKSETQERVLVIAGEKDTLMRVELMRNMAADYRQQFTKFAKNLWSSQSEATVDEREKTDSQQGIGFEVVPGSGHHIQNDLHWEDGARKILAFLDRL